MYIKAKIWQNALDFLFFSKIVKGFVCPSGVIDLKSGNMIVLDTFCVCLSVEGEFGCGWGLDAPAHPSVTVMWPRVTCFPFKRQVDPWSSKAAKMAWKQRAQAPRQYTTFLRDDESIRQNYLKLDDVTFKVTDARWMISRFR